MAGCRDGQGIGLVIFGNLTDRLFVAAIMASLAASAPAAERTIHIRHDTGGDLRLYQIKARVARELNLNVVIDGLCASACTVLIQLPRAQICATRRAELRFHRVRLAKPVRNGAALLRHANQELMRSYPPGIRNWINRRGGLTDRSLRMKPTEVARYIRTCSGSDLLS